MNAPRIKIVRCSEHSHIAIIIDDKLVHCDDHQSLEALAEELVRRGVITLEEEEIDFSEFEERYA